MRTPEMREIAQSLATLGLAKVTNGDSLNLRRRENVRRKLQAAGETLRWSEITALSDDPVNTAAVHVKKIVKSGVRLLERLLAEEVATKKAETARLGKVVKTVQGLAEDPEVEYPTEVVFDRTAKSPGEGLVTKTEVLTFADAEEARKAAVKMEASLPAWGKLRDEMLDDLRQRKKNLDLLDRSLPDLVDSWRGLLGEVLVTML